MAVVTSRSVTQRWRCSRRSGSGGGGRYTEGVLRYNADRGCYVYAPRGLQPRVRQARRTCYQCTASLQLYSSVSASVTTSPLLFLGLDSVFASQSQSLLPESLFQGNTRSVVLLGIAIGSWYWQRGKKKRKQKKRMAKREFVRQARDGTAPASESESESENGSDSEDLDCDSEKILSDDEGSILSGKWTVLLISVVIDAAGMASYFLPFAGELSDLVEAPLAAIAIQKLYGSMLMSSVLLVEEMLPFTDAIPTATIAWLLKFTALGKLIPILPQPSSDDRKSTKKKKQ